MALEKWMANKRFVPMLDLELGYGQQLVCMQVNRWFATDIHIKWGKSLGPHRGEKTGILSNEILRT